MSGDVTYQALKRLSWLPDRDAGLNGTVIGGQEYTDVEFIGGAISNVTLTDVTINGVETARNERVITASGGVTVESDDYVITILKDTPATTTVTLPASPTTSRSIIVKDGAGNAGTYNITIDGNGKTIDDESTFVLTADYEAVEIIYNGTQWNVIGGTKEFTAVIGPGSSTDNAVVRFNGATGQLIQDSTVTISDAGIVAGLSIDTAASANTISINGTSLTAVTGTGEVVLATSPTLVTPVLGAATATSINTVVLSGASTPNLTVNGTAVVSGTNTGDQNLFSTIAVSGQSDIVADGTSDTLTLAAGSNITLTTDPSTDTVTISSSVPVSGITVGTTTVTGGTNTRVLYNNSGVVGEYSVSGSGNVAMTTSPTFVTPILGTPTSGTLTNCTIPVGGITGLGTGVGAFLATPSSADLAAAVTDETGSGALVFATSPTLVTPVLGTPSSGNLSSCTALPLSTGVTGNLSVNNLNSGTNASSSTFWRGDGTWANAGNPIASGTTAMGGTLQNTMTTAITSSVDRIEIYGQATSTGNAAAFYVQLGDSGGLENSGYNSAYTTNGAADSTASAGFQVLIGTNTGQFYITLFRNPSNNLWSAYWQSQTDGASLTMAGNGQKTTSTTTDRVGFQAGTTAVGNLYWALYGSP